jgi:protein-L-isoaspartate O-methyltransferase
VTTPAGLARALEAKGALPPEWARTVAAVDRALFVPDRTPDLDGAPGLDRDADPAGWLAAVYADRPIVTRVNHAGLPVSSTSAPSLMLEMLALLRAEPGQDVLEIGTGTGYNAAWLTHRLGAGHVTSVEYDPETAAHAERNLHNAGLRPRLRVGDGLKGRPGDAPYDRVLATCTVSEVPYPWVAQTRPGGRIVTPWGNGLYAGSLAALTVIADGTAYGSFHGNPDFMFAHRHRPPRHPIHHVYRGQTGTPGRTRTDPRHLLTDDALFFLSLTVPQAATAWHPAPDNTGEATLWLLADDARSWATAEYVPGPDHGQRTYATDQFGPRKLWDEAETAYRHWHDLGAPARDRFGITIDPDGQHVWLDTPATLITGPAFTPAGG